MESIRYHIHFQEIITKEDVIWPGSVKLAIDEIGKCHREWIKFVETLSEQELCSDKMCKWPFEGQNMYPVCWDNVIVSYIGIQCGMTNRSLLKGKK